MNKNLPPIFKISTGSIPTNNISYYKTTTNNQAKEVKKEVISVKEDSTSIDDKINQIFKTRGYPFNIPVTITFAGKTLDTYLAVKTSSSVITLDNEVRPISTITSLQIKKNHQ